MSDLSLFICEIHSANLNTFAYVCKCVCFIYCYSRGTEQCKLFHWRISLHPKGEELLQMSSTCPCTDYVITWRWLPSWNIFHLRASVGVMRASHPVQHELISKVWVTNSHQRDIQRLVMYQLLPCLSVSASISISLSLLPFYYLF